MHDRRILTMQIDQCIEDRLHNGQNQGKRKIPFWLLCEQNFQVSSLDVIHERIYPFEFFIFKRLVNMGQCPVIESLEHLCFKDEVFAVAPVRINYLFKSKQTLLDTPVPDQVDSAKSPFTKKAFYDIAFSIGMLDYGSNGERHLFF